MTTGKRILIVEDDTTLLEMLSDQLQLHEEFSTVGVTSAAEA
ncbi:MAG TPA: DNA-binding response regulator, partial [Rhodospirillales bacterium]|nr:DNA-binding response regulator [Rhodospirillales bacterium]